MRVGAAMFHAADGLCFERVRFGPDFGSVRIMKYSGAVEDSVITLDIELSSEVWASVVASMTVLGETGGLWRAVLALQKGE